jgi:gas vesicle protein
VHLLSSSSGIIANNQQERSEVMSSKKVMIGAVVGVAAGAVLGLLFAPAKGAMMRQKMARKITDRAEDIQESLGEYIDSTTEEFDSVKQGAMDLIETAKKKAASASQKLRQVR